MPDAYVAFPQGGEESDKRILQTGRTYTFPFPPRVLLATPTANARRESRISRWMNRFVKSPETA